MGMTLQQAMNPQDQCPCMELNPMMGHRGCRLPITYPEIAEMQTRAVIEAAIERARRKHPDYNITSGNHDPAGRRREGAEVRARTS